MMMTEFVVIKQMVQGVAPAIQDFGLALGDSLEDAVDAFGTQERPSDLLPPKATLKNGQIEIPSSLSDYDWEELDNKIAK